MGSALNRRPRIGNGIVLFALVFGMGVGLCGCGPIGAVLNGLPLAPIQAKYKDLKGQSVAVMVWADRGIRVDFPKIQLDAANGIQSKLVKAKKDKNDELKDTKFPMSAATVIRFQEDHPEWAADSIEEIAPRLGVSRVIYVEIDGFQTRSDSAVDLFRGTLTATVRVVEITNGKARVVHTEEDMRSIYPEKSPEEGVPSIGDFETYRQTVDAFTTSVANLFYTHPNPEN